MSKKIKITKEQLEEAIKNGYDTQKKLVDFFKVSKTTIIRRLSKYKIKLFKYKFDTNVFLELYKNGYNDCEIGRILNISNTAISRYREKLGLKSNFLYKREILRNQILECFNRTKSIEQTAQQLNLDYRLIELFINEKIVSYDYQLTNVEEQVIIGSLLGDGSISCNKSGNQAKLVFAHSPKQKEYCIFKTILLQNIMYFERSFMKSYQQDKRFNVIECSYRALSKELKVLKDFYDRWYIKENNRNIKTIDKTDLFKLDALGLAIWFQDDGYKDHNTGYVLCTECFKKEDIMKIIEYFDKKWDINVRVRASNEIYIGSKYRDKFKNIIMPYISKDCTYKLIK